MKLVLYRDDGNEFASLDDVEQEQNPRVLAAWVKQQVAAGQYSGDLESDMPAVVIVGQNSPEREHWITKQFAGCSDIIAFRYDRATGQVGFYIEDDGIFHRQCVFDWHWIPYIRRAAGDAFAHIRNHLPRKKKKKP